MRYAHFLKEKGTIGFVAPSMGCSTQPYKDAFDNALSIWKQRGYHIKLGTNCYRNNGIGISNTPRQCGREFTEFYIDTDNDCLISCGGGELMCEILDEVDFEAVRKAAPKWFMGFSDNTNMTFLLATICDTASIYGPCASAFGMEPWHKSLEDAWQLLSGTKLQVEGYNAWEVNKLKDEEHPLLPYNCTEEQSIRLYIPHEINTETEDTTGFTEYKGSNAVEIKGRLLGGCMDSLINLIGTRYDEVEDFIDRYKQDGIIWFLEACDLNLFSIRRAMWHMNHAGWFQYVKGFIFGRPYCYGQEGEGLDQYEAVLHEIRKLQVPVVMDVDLGHLPPMMPLVTGSMAKIMVKQSKISIQMEMI